MAFGRTWNAIWCDYMRICLMFRKKFNKPDKRRWCNILGFNNIGGKKILNRQNQNAHLGDLNFLFYVQAGHWRRDCRAWVLSQRNRVAGQHGELVVVVGRGRCDYASAQRLHGHLSLSHHLQLSRPVPFVHWSEFISAPSHPIGSDSWNIKHAFIIKQRIIRTSINYDRALIT